jgi:hypothetical protein
LLAGLRLLEALINGRHHGLRCRCNGTALGRPNVALLAVIKRQPKYVTERDERALGGVGFGRLDAVFDGLADCGAEAAMSA